MPITSVNKVQLNKMVKRETAQQLRECSFHLDKKPNEVLELALSRFHHSVVVRGENTQSLSLKLDEVLARVSELGEADP